VQRASAEKFAVFAAQAIDNAHRFSSLERRSFRDPVTKTYTRAYFDDVVHNEIRKAARFGRTFSLVRLELDGLADLRARVSESEFVEWVESLAFHVGRALRATDLLAAESESRFCVLLPETDSVGAAVLKRRIRAALERSEPWRDLTASERPELLLGAATFPTDGTQLEALWAVLEGRVDEDRRSLVRSLELDAMPFRGLVDTLLAEGLVGKPETGEQMTRYLLDEVARRPHERGLLFVAPGAGMARSATGSSRSAGSRRAPRSCSSPKGKAHRCRASRSRGCHPFGPARRRRSSSTTAKARPTRCCASRPARTAA
jgi:diguanylate cyclase (GGDEF)-like protein